MPCAISWLFKLINERKEKTGTRFSVRVSAVEIFGKDEELKDLLSEVSTGSLQEGQSLGIHLREDPICGTQVRGGSPPLNQTNLSVFADAFILSGGYEVLVCLSIDLFLSMIYRFYSQRCLTFSCESVSMCAFMCVFISQDILVHLALSYLLLKSFFYFCTKPICGMDGFLLTFILTILSAHISIYYPYVRASPLQHNRIIIGGMVKVCTFEGAHRCCCQMLFFGDLYVL